MDRKWKGLLSYLLGWVGGLIVLFAFKDNDRKTAFHACQAITISVCQIILSLGLGIISGIMAAATGFGGISYLSSIVSILFFVLMIMGIVKSMNDEPDPKLPVVGDLTEKFFLKKINEFPEAAAASTNFDPNTGQPVNQQASFDPNTGQPITQPEAQPAPEAKFDPNTGQPVGQSADAPAQPEEAPAEEKPAEETPAEENK